MSPSTHSIFAAIFFGLAVLHTFSVKFFQHWARQFPKGSFAERLFHLLGEVELVFGVWAAILLLLTIPMQGAPASLKLLTGANFTEPLFVFVIMSVAATRPVLELAGEFIQWAGARLPFRGLAGFYFAALVLGPLLGSFMTEPAAMTVTAILLRDRVLHRKCSPRLLYTTLGTLFVNVSIGGVLTHFAAPPVLMVASIWKWDTPFLFMHFGWKAAVAVVINALLVTFANRDELGLAPRPAPEKRASSSPRWLQAVHLAFLVAIVVTGHHAHFFFPIFLAFLAVFHLTRLRQTPLALRPALLVGFFLAGLVVLGGQQRWWLEPLIRQLDTVALYLGTAALTAITDNAALTFLGAQVPGVSFDFQYSLVAGAVAGGGLTVIANAPNPAGYSILNPSFGPEGISASRLLLGALIPTAIALSAFWWLPSF